MRMGMGKSMLLRKLAVIAIAGALLVNVSPVSAKAGPVTLSINEDWARELQHTPLIEDSSVLLPLRETGALLHSNTTYISEGKRIVVTNPQTRIELQLDSKEAKVNGKSYQLPTLPKNVNGVVYVPVRFIAETLGAKVEWIGSERRVHIEIEEPYLYAASGVKGYWLSKETGALFLSVYGSAAAPVGQVDIELKGWSGMSADRLSERAEVLRVSDSYGEPFLNDHVYALLVADAKIILQTYVYYTGKHVVSHIERTKDGHALLMDGATLYIVDSAGKTVNTYNLNEVLGYDDNAYQVEYMDDRYIAVRPFQTGWLTLLDRRSEQTIRLADHLLSGEQIEIYNSLNKNDFEFARWDGLEIIGREGDTLLLAHYWFLEGETVELEFEVIE